MNDQDKVWREKLSAEQYRVTREHGTEAPFSGAYYNTTDDGRYLCVCCGAVLFDAEEKYDSGCGWPSFWQAAEVENITEIPDHSHGMVRTEVQCSHCQAHLGHVFPDGPRPTGLRYCINSVALDFEKRRE